MNRSPLQRSNRPANRLASIFAQSSLRPIAAVIIVLVLLSTSFIVGVLLHARAATPTSTTQSQGMQHSAVVAMTKPFATITTSTAPWRTLRTFTGTGRKKTVSFIVPNDWGIAWSCKPGSQKNANYYLMIHAHTATNALLANSVETTCSKSNTHSFVELHQGGVVYLSILGGGSWSIQIQVH